MCALIVPEHVRKYGAVRQQECLLMRVRIKIGKEKQEERREDNSSERGYTKQQKQNRK